MMRKGSTVYLEARIFGEVEMPYYGQKERSDKVAEELAKSEECFISGERARFLFDYAAKTMKLDLGSYDVKSTRKLLKGISLADIVSESRAAKYENLS